MTGFRGNTRWPLQANCDFAANTVIEHLHTHFHSILADLVNGLWSVIEESFARNPVVLSQLHSVLQQETDPGRQLLVVH